MSANSIDFSGLTDVFARSYDLATASTELVEAQTDVEELIDRAESELIAVAADAIEAGADVDRVIDQLLDW